MARMTSKFPGKCSVCPARFAAGADIDYDRGTKQVRCAECAEGKPPSSRPSSPARETSRVERTWSKFQAAIFADVATATGHTVVRARAGTGKTTTIVEALYHVPAGASVLMVAFNKKIAEELQSRAPGGVRVKTCHGFGFSALMSVRKVRLDQNRVRAHLEDRNPEWTAERIGALCKAVGLAKGMLASEALDIDDIIDRFELDVPEYARAEFCRDAIEVMAWCKRDTGTCDFDAGDFIISRKNAPLIGLCLDFLKRGVRANIAGRDVGASLLTLVSKSGAATVAELTKYVDEWCSAECARLAAKKPPRDSQSVEDRAECISALCEGAKSVADVRARIEDLFSDKDDSARIMLTTTHKAKGLERERCWILTETYQPRRSTEEANLWYVAVTRAKSELYLVGSAAPVAPQPSPDATPPEPAPPTEPSPASASGLCGLGMCLGVCEGPCQAPAPNSPPPMACPEPAMGVVRRRSAEAVESRTGLMPQSETDAKPARFNGRCGCGKAHSILADGRQCHRRYGWLWHTSKGAMGEDNRGARLSFWVSCDCGKMVRLWKVDGTYNAEKKCDGRCMSAKGFVCECSCGGKNHGASHG